MARATVAAVIADALARAGTRRVFAAPGASPALTEAARARGLAVVDVAGATAACVMAAVTGELDDAPGAAFVSLARGVTAVVDGAAHATRDRAPVIVVSDGAADPRLLEPVTKASLTVDAAAAGHWIAHAAQASMTFPRGAVHLGVPIRIADAATLPVATSCRPAPLATPPPDTLDALADALANAARPILVTGLEVTPDDAPWIRALAETLPAPVLCTPKGKGALPDPHPLALGLLAADHTLAARADIVMALGADAVELPPETWPAAAATLRVGRSAGPAPSAPLVDVVADIGLVIADLAPRLRDRTRADWDVAELDRLKRRLAARSPAGAGLDRRQVVEIAREATPAGTLLALDVPLAEAWQSVAPRELLIPTGVATLGFALPAALAAALARPAQRVVGIGSASGLTAMVDELATAARLGVPVVIVTFAQDIALAQNDRVLHAGEAGLPAWTAHDEASFREAFARAWSAGRPALVTAQVVR
jgi:acetolactate synthase-1/2/3 large subunit